MPLAFPGVPGPQIFIHQLVDGRVLVVADKVVAADFAVGQQLQRALQRCGGVMEHDELNATVVVGRSVAGVVSGAAGATSQQDQRHDESKIFHGKANALKTVMQQCNVLPCACWPIATI
ncbi:hypothetical protein D3C81_1477760 [compost metagenome]